MKTLFLFGASLFLSVAAFSQSSSSHSTSPVQFGIKAGVNVAKMVQSGPEPYDHRVNFHVGGLAHIHLSSAFALQPEVVYSRQGAEYSAGKDKFDYINVPVLAQYMRKGFRIETGPQAGFLVSAKLKNRSNNMETDLKSSLETFDFSWAFGLGYLTRSGLGVDARYNLGISDITEQLNNENKHRVWQFGVFYQFSH